MNMEAWPCVAGVLTDVTVHHLGTVFAHGLQVVDLALQEWYLGFQVLLLLITHTHTHTHTGQEEDNKNGGEQRDKHKDMWTVKKKKKGY